MMMTDSGVHSSRVPLLSALCALHIQILLMLQQLAIMEADFSIGIGDTRLVVNALFDEDISAAVLVSGVGRVAHFLVVSASSANEV